ncbi:MAG: filamentous hemagglutinin N-terminal domain-containing protein, partial [Desulfobulbaceae bacterium]|nr:filamentous hemagglutinin N-terminal domain-containing protein [Desulfobulbaceae bacterium]
MNKIYRLIFSTKRGCLIPVAEIVKSHGKGDTQGSTTASASRVCRRMQIGLGLSLGLTVLLGGGVPCLYAATLPTGGSVAVGNGSIATAGTTMTVQQNTQKLGVNWQSFDIGADSKVVFKQPDTSSVALNRVVGGSRSEIYGKLEANGQVFLVNPNGVLFGKTAEVTVGGLVATTKNITDADFKAGNHHFSGTGESGEVINQGNLKAIKGGYIVLAGNTVRNQGTISATGGNAVLAAGETITLNLDTTGQLKVKVDGTTLQALIDNQGLIAADGGQVLLTARGKEMAQTSAINLQGVVRARSIGAKNGKVVIDGGSTGTVVATDAKIDVSGLNAGEKGGNVTLTGQKVGLLGTTGIDARGAVGGGTVLVGGDYQGKGELAHAQKVVMGKKAKIDASATEKGKGGKVVLWSDAYTGFYGEIAAQGGILGGDGGLVETSSHDNLQAFGKVEANAPFGLAGTWLLDPTNVTIVAGAANTNDTDGGTGIWNPTATGAQIGVTNINTELNAGTSVIINTTSGLAEAGNITINAAIAKTGGANTSLTLNAAGSIVLNAGISSTIGQLATTLNASSGSISGNGAINTNGGLLTLNNATSGTHSGIISGSGGLTKTGAGTQILTGANSYSGITTIDAGTLQVGSGGAIGTLGSGAVTINANANLLLNRSDTVNLSTLAPNAAGIAGAGNVTALIGGGFTVDRAINLTGAGSTSILSQGNVNFMSSVQSSGTGAVNVVAGWDGTTGVSGGMVDMTALAANSNAYGQNAGSVVIGDGTQTTGISIGSKDGVSTVLTNDLTLKGSNVAYAWAMLGYHG